MNEITLIRLEKSNSRDGLDEAVRHLKEISEAVVIENANWPEFPYLPTAAFRAGWSGSGIVLHYELVERRVNAHCLDTNGPVCRDSCVEFFVSDSIGGYFNFEFNAAGTRYAAHGSGREDSRPLPVETVESIVCETALSGRHWGMSEDETAWTLSALIPLSIFTGTPLENPGGKSFRANFYKCAEDTGAPHFLSWNPVKTDAPDFHRPEYFGTVNFAD